jgi:hypothetical protein
MSANEPLLQRRKVKDDTKTGALTVFRNSMAGTYLLAMRGPAYRRHDSGAGFRTELENRVGDDKGKGTKWRTHKAESTDAPIRGALPRRSEEAG